MHAEPNYDDVVRQLAYPPGSIEDRLHEAERRSLAETAFLRNVPLMLAQNKTMESLIETLAVHIARLEGPDGPDMEYMPAHRDFVQSRDNAELAAFAAAILNPNFLLRDILGRAAPDPSVAAPRMPSPTPANPPPQSPPLQHSSVFLPLDSSGFEFDQSAPFYAMNLFDNDLRQE